MGLHTLFVHPEVTADLKYVEKEIESIRHELQARRKKFIVNCSPADLAGRTIILVDDGIATGHTRLSAIKFLPETSPQSIIVAVSVACPNAVERIREKADVFICVLVPMEFSGVGQFYADFDEVKDVEVKRLLHLSR